MLYVWLHFELNNNKDYSITFVRQFIGEPTVLLIFAALIKLVVSFIRFEDSDLHRSAFFSDGSGILQHVTVVPRELLHVATWFWCNLRYGCNCVDVYRASGKSGSFPSHRHHHHHCQQVLDYYTWKIHEPLTFAVIVAAIAGIFNLR